jgi:hypothetical protein
MTTGADWLDTARRVLDSFLTPPAPSPASPAEAEEGRAHAETCRWCPVCQAMAVARGERPEVTAALADLLTSTAEALRTFAESAPAAEHEAATDIGEDRAETTPEDADPTAPPARSVQRIDIG